MFKKLFFLFSLIYFVKVYSQSKNLLGTWILDKIIYSNGKDIEVNTELFSYELIYKIAPNRITINDYLFDATFDENVIQMGNRKINYEFKNNYFFLKMLMITKFIYF